MSPPPPLGPLNLHPLSQTPKGPGIHKPPTRVLNGNGIQKPATSNGSKTHVVGSALPMPFILQPPEEQTDNWDDDFEEGISLTKLQGETLGFWVIVAFMRLDEFLIPITLFGFPRSSSREGDSGRREG